MNPCRLMFAATSLALAITPCASAASEDWKTSVWIGPYFSLTGGLVDPYLLTGGAQTENLYDTQLLNYRDAFHIGPELGIETLFVASDAFQPFLRLTYSAVRNRLPEDALPSIAPLPDAFHVRHGIDNLQNSALDVGLRNNLPVEHGLHPFMSVFLGASHADALDVDPAAARQLTVLPQDTRLDAGAEAGAVYQLTPKFELHADVAAEYLGTDRIPGAAVSLPGLSTQALRRPHWSTPLVLGFAFRFSGAVQPWSAST